MYKKYKSEFEYSYTLGTAPTLELVKYKPDTVQVVFTHSSAVGTAGFNDLRQICDQNRVTLEVNDKQIARLSLKENIHALGIFNKYKSKLNSERDHMVLVNPADMGNLGTIIRSMVSFGVFDLAMITPAADVFSPRCVRATMGALFMMNFECFDSFAAYKSKFSQHTSYPFMLDGRSELSEVEFASPASLVFGNESSGLAPEFLNQGEPVFIQQTDLTDSLNLSVSASVALYKLMSYRSD